MPVIGLTGNIGSGKSTVARRLKKLGAKIIDADQVAREAVRAGTPALKEIVANFGAEVLNTDGNLDRKRLGAIVFTDPRARARLNQITHPRINETILREIKKHRLNQSPRRKEVLVIDVPLLLETGLELEVDEVWVVKINEDKLVKRLAERDALMPDEILKRLEAQMPQEEKLKYARRVIDNNGELQETEKQVDRHWLDFINEHFPDTGSI
ncbi:MAG: Dephospho-CoA kinase [Pelotomaculum thermopropionicum]|uniref:Dephospho-CoA kinase n=1 Tax=Pelotomaculum thermopropionicum TaxID=110500 RepID=A0A117M3F6_9FIRM|nr:MAG: Dephospho-CoA kinase [Pelotomaculum thermopropionicum]